MPSLTDLEEEYAHMNCKNKGHIQVTPRLDKTCLAITAMGGWNLQSHTWQRFQRWLKKFSSRAIFYNLQPSGSDGLLHWTLQQCQPFGSTNNELYDYTALNVEPIVRGLAGIQIVYRGVVLTPSGIALAGYPVNEEYYQRILAARAALPDAFQKANIPYSEPYKNTICHATVLRWTSEPTPSQLQYLYEGITQWNEAVFGTLRPYKWVLGDLTLRVRDHEICIYKEIYTPLRIAHRGLRDGPNSALENRVDLIEENIRDSIPSEIDIWRDSRGNLWLGHDAPTYSITLDWILQHQDYLLIHAKDTATFHFLKRYSDEGGHRLMIFYHTDEDVVLTTQANCIVYPGQEVLDGWMSMMPERAPEVSITLAGYVCSDYYNL